MENPKNELISKILEYRRLRRHKVNSKYPQSGAKQNDPAKTQTCIEKGRLFESYVVKKFDPDYFTLIEWRSDKCVDDIYPVMSLFPDLEFYFQSTCESAQIAVECKWREHFFKNGFEIEGHKLENYFRYQEIMGIPTFLIIGIGNSPTNPDAVYTIPLSEIKKPFIHEFELEVYRKKNITENFFLHCSKLILF